MRNLTIIREKSKTAPLATVKIYAEDHYLPDTYINKVPCRKLGSVKNGETATFKINEKEARIFAIRSKKARHCFNDCTLVDEGDFDVTLSGKVKPDFARGNCFRFDSEGDYEIGEARAKAKRRATYILLAVISVVMTLFVMGSMNGFGNLIDESRPIYNTETWTDEAKPKMFVTSDMHIILNENFTSSDMKGFEACYVSQKITVFVVKETFKDYPELKDISLQEYIKKIVEANKIENSETVEENGKTYFISEHKNSKTEESETYYGYVFKTEYEFWFIQFGAKTSDIEPYIDDIKTWADSIEFGQLPTK